MVCEPIQQQKSDRNFFGRLENLVDVFDPSCSACDACQMAAQMDRPKGQTALVRLVPMNDAKSLTAAAPAVARLHSPQPEATSQQSLSPEEKLAALRRQNGSYFFTLLGSARGVERAITYGTTFLGELDASTYTGINELLNSPFFQKAIDDASGVPSNMSRLVTMLTHVEGINPKDFLDIVVHSIFWPINDADWYHLVSVANARGVWSAPFDWKAIFDRSVSTRNDSRIAYLVQFIMCGELNPSLPKDGKDNGQDDGQDGEDDVEYDVEDDGVTKDRQLYQGTVFGKILESRDYTSRTLAAMLSRVWDIDFQCVSGSFDSGDQWLAIAKKWQADLGVAVPLLLKSILECPNELITIVTAYAFQPFAPKDVKTCVTTTDSQRLNDSDDAPNDVIDETEITTVMKQANVGRDLAAKSLRKTGNIVDAILALSTWE